MKKTEVRVNERACFSCGYCEEFCPHKCLKMTVDRMSPLGYALPVLTKPEKCTACGTCARMCPRWAIEVSRLSEDPQKGALEEKIAHLPFDPPLSGCPGCQHPTVGRIILEAIADLGLDNAVNVIEGIPCATSSAFGMDFGTKLACGEIPPDAATVIKRDFPETPLIAVMGYWGLSDFSFDVGALISALIRGENFTVVLCNMPFYSPKDGRPGPANEPVRGRLEPATRISTPEGPRLIVGGYPLRVAELVATFPGVAYSARGTVTSMEDYQRTKNYVKKALQRQMEGKGLGLVEVLCICSDPAYTAPAESLRWVREKMVAEFPLGELTDKGRVAE